MTSKGATRSGRAKEGAIAKRSEPALDRTKVRALDAATKRIHALTRRAGEAFYELGRELGAVQEAKLYRARYGTFEAYAQDEAKIHPATAYTLIRIAQRFKVEAARELGLERLEAAIRLMDATPADEDPRKVASIAVKTRNGKKPLAEASVVEIAEAAQAERAKRDRRGARKKVDRRATPAEGTRLAAQAEKDLRRAGHEGVAVRARRAPAGDDGGARFVADLCGLAPEALKKAVRALTR